MGKNLKNKELGKGLSQREDGRYTARFVNKCGKRVQKYFDSLPEARNWLDDAKHKDKYDSVIAPFEMVAEGIMNDEDPVLEFSDMTVDEWCEFWTRNLISELRSNTVRNYRERYIFNISPVI